MSSFAPGLGVDLREKSAHISSSLGLSMNHTAPGRRPATVSGISTTSYIPTLRSMTAIHGQSAGYMVQLDESAGVGGFHNHEHISSDGQTAALSRDDTLLNLDATPARNAAELKSLLGNNYSRLKPGAAVLPPPSPFLQKLMDENEIYGPVSVELEQAKPRARVEVDIVLESDTCVQGNYLKGRVKVHVRQVSKTEPPVWLAQGRVRIIGYEYINDDDRHTFYQCTAPLSTAASSTETLYISDADEEGYAEAKEGIHVFPFAIWLPLDESCGIARGVVQIPSGATVRYIAMASFKVKCPATNARSIAHFYRNCEIWPRLDPSFVLATAPRPLLAQTSKSVFLGGKGKISLTAQLHRLHWIAGQRCYLKFSVTNDTKKTVKSLTLGLIRTTTMFRPLPQLDALPRCADPDACQTSTTRKQVASSVLDMAHSGEKGHASAKGWWTGVPANQKLEFSHFILLPPSALSFTRVRLLEVEYTIRVSLSAGSLGADVHVILPIRVINFLSIDPPPSTFSASPEAISGRYFMRESDLPRNKTSIRAVRGYRALMDGGFAGAPYSDYATPRFDDGPSEHSVSIYDDSSSMDEHPPQRHLDVDPGSVIDSAECSGNKNFPRFDMDFRNVSTTTDRLPSIHPQGPRQPSIPSSGEPHTQPALTAFELRVQEKLHAFATSAVKTTVETNSLASNVSPTRSEHGYLEPYGKDTLLKPPNVVWKTPGAAADFSLPPSHKLPRPPLITPRPMMKMHLTDPGPMPAAPTRTKGDSSAAALPIFKAQSYAGPDTRVSRPDGNRKRSQTLSMSRPPLPSPAGSAFSAVRSRIIDMEEKVFELNQRTDGVVPFF